MKEVFEQLLEGFIKGSSYYKEIEKEAEDFNTECNRKQRRIEKLQHELRSKEQERKELVLNGQGVIEEKILTIKNLENDITNLENKLKEKENQRRKAVGSIGGLKRQIKKRDEEINTLNERIEFLKTNRRSPNLEELKDYTLRRKRR